MPGMMMGLIGSGFGGGGIGGGTLYSTETNDWAAQVVTNGGTAPSNVSKSAIDALINSIKGGANTGPALNSCIDRLWPLANADNSASATDIQSLTSIVNPGAAATLSGTFTSKLSGYLSNGTTGFINSGFNPFTAGGNYTQNKGTIGTYGLTNRSASADTISIGMYDGTNDTQILPFRSLANVQALNSVAGQEFTGVAHNADGFSIVTRIDSTHCEMFQFYSDTSFNSGSVAVAGSVAPINLNFFICARNNQSSADSFLNEKLGLAFIGGLTPAQCTDLAGYVNTYMTSLGLAVHS
jgi:hypothetical protein